MLFILRLKTALNVQSKTKIQVLGLIAMTGRCRAEIQTNGVLLATCREESFLNGVIWLILPNGIIRRFKNNEI